MEFAWGSCPYDGVYLFCLKRGHSMQISWKPVDNFYLLASKENLKNNTKCYDLFFYSETSKNVAKLKVAHQLRVAQSSCQ